MDTLWKKALWWQLEHSLSGGDGEGFMMTEYILFRVEAVEALWLQSIYILFLVVTIKVLWWQEYILFRVVTMKALCRQSIFFSGWRRRRLCGDRIYSYPGGGDEGFVAIFFSGWRRRRWRLCGDRIYSFPGGSGEGFLATEYILFRVEAMKALWWQSIFFSGWRL